MADGSTIEWLSMPGTKPASWNPVRARNRQTGKIGWHCEHATPGCANCYSEGFNRRLGTGLPFKPGHRADLDILFDERMLLAPLRWRQPRSIFVHSMTDTFAPFVTDDMLDRIFAVMALCPQHFFFVLTKRSPRMRAYLTGPHRERWAREMERVDADPRRRALAVAGCYDLLALPNVLLGVSVEDQTRADERVPDLLATPAAVRWVSAEPLLGPIDFRKWLVGSLREVADDIARETLLDDEVRLNRGQDREHVPSPVNLPAPARLPAAFGNSSHVPAGIAADAGQPVNQVSGSAVDGQARAVGSPGSLPPVDVPFTVEEAGNVGQLCGGGRHSNSLRQSPGAWVAEVNASSLKPPTHVGAMDPGQSTQLGQGLTPFVEGQKLSGFHAANSSIDWVVVGGESGPGARPMHPQWARDIRDQCAAAGVPFFFKQWGAWAPAPNGDDTYEGHRARGGCDLALLKPGLTPMELVGKTRAGRLLDCVEHSAMPEVQSCR